MNVLVGTKQFKMILEEEFVERLRDLAKKAGRDSAQHLAEEILTIYLPVWVSVHDATRRAVGFQTQVIAEKQRKLMADIEPIMRVISTTPDKLTDETASDKKRRRA